MLQVYVECKTVYHGKTVATGTKHVLV